MIKTENLTKKYGKLLALNDVTLSIERGSVTAVLGPNGAGKTTLIKSLLGLVKPDKGYMYIDGEEVSGKSTYRKKIGYMPQAPAYPENLKVREIIAMVKDLRGNPADTDTGLMEKFELKKELDKSFKKLSGGNKQKTSALLAFMFDPQVLFLDEPTAGLDPRASSHLKDKVMSEQEKGKTIVLTSHNMSDIQELASNIIYLAEGRVYYTKNMDELMAASGEKTLERAIARLMEEQPYADVKDL